MLPLETIPTTVKIQVDSCASLCRITKGPPVKQKMFQNILYKKKIDYSEPESPKQESFGDVSDPAQI